MNLAPFIGMPCNRSNSKVKSSGYASVNSGINNPGFVSHNQRPCLPSIDTISAAAVVFHPAGKSPILPVEKSSKPIILSPGTKSYCKL